MKLIYAVMIDAYKNWHGVKMTVEIMEELSKLWAEAKPKPNTITKPIQAQETVLV